LENDSILMNKSALPHNVENPTAVRQLSSLLNARILQANHDDRPPKCKSLEVSEGPLRRAISEADGPRLVLVGDGARASESEAVFNMVTNPFPLFLLSDVEFPVTFFPIKKFDADFRSSQSCFPLSNAEGGFCRHAETLPLPHSQLL
jgi:hypothetical protein